MAIASVGTGVPVGVGVRIDAGTGSPEGLVTGNKGALWLQTDHADGWVIWQKSSGVGKTGWTFLAITSGPHGNTNYVDGDASVGGQLRVYSQIIGYGHAAGGGADLVLLAPKHRLGGIDYDIHLGAEKVSGVLGTGVCFVDMDIKVADFVQAPFRGHGLRFLQTDNSAVMEFPISGGGVVVYGKLIGANSAQLNMTTRIGGASGFFIVENHLGTLAPFTVDDKGLARTLSGTYVGVGDPTNPVSGVQYRVPAVLFQSGNFTTTSNVDASITTYVLKGGTLGTAFSAIRIAGGGREITQNGSFNIKFGATVIFTVAPLVGENWWFEVKITRIGGTTERVTGITCHNATVVAVTAVPGETLANDITIDFRGSVTAGGTLALDDVSVEYMSSI